MKNISEESSSTLNPEGAITMNSSNEIDFKQGRNHSIKKTVFKGIITDQITVTKEEVKLSDQASPQFINEINPLLKNPVVLFPGLNRGSLGSDQVTLDESKLTFLVELLKQIAEAKRVIASKYNELNGILGSAISELEYGANDGFYQKYERGAIYLSRGGAVHEVHGAIYERYLSLRAEAGFLGYPISDEQSTTLGTGRFNHFQGGSIYWSETTGAWEIHGAIMDKWLTLFADRSFLGFPTSNEEDYKGSTGRISYFKNGSIIFLSDDSSLIVTSDAVVRSLSLSASSVNCNLEFSMNSAGDWRYKGHLHNSGFFGFNVTVFTTLRFQNANGDIFGVNIERHLDGTTSLGDERGDDWDVVGNGEQFIIDNWDTLRFSGINSVLAVNVTFGDIVQAVVLALPIAVGAIILGAIAGGGKVCPARPCTKWDPIKGQYEPSICMPVVSEDQQCPGDF